MPYLTGITAENDHRNDGRFLVSSNLLKVRTFCNSSVSNEPYKSRHSHRPITGTWGGGGEIRTHGSLRNDGLVNRWFKPLIHASSVSPPIDTSTPFAPDKPFENKPKYANLWRYLEPCQSGLTYLFAKEAGCKSPRWFESSRLRFDNMLI